jgi:hypothetical protein
VGSDAVKCCVGISTFRRILLLPSSGFNATYCTYFLYSDYDDWRSVGKYSWLLKLNISGDGRTDGSYIVAGFLVTSYISI